MGCKRYFLVPKGLIQKDEIPDGWGFVEYNESSDRCIRIKNATVRDPYRYEEILLLCSQVRKLQFENFCIKEENTRLRNLVNAPWKRKKDES